MNKIHKRRRILCMLHEYLTWPRSVIWHKQLQMPHTMDMALGLKKLKNYFFFFYKLKVSGISLQIVYMCQHVFDQNAICVLENLKRSEKHCFSNLTYKLYFKSFITHMCVCFPASLYCLLQNIVIAVKYWVILNVKIVTDNIIAGLMQRKK